jgi:hypothetical protein
MVGRLVVAALASVGRLLTPRTIAARWAARLAAPRFSIARRTAGWLVLPGSVAPWRTCGLVLPRPIAPRRTCGLVLPRSIATRRTARLFVPGLALARRAAGFVPWPIAARRAGARAALVAGPRLPLVAGLPTPGTVASRRTAARLLTPRTIATRRTRRLVASPRLSLGSWPRRLPLPRLVAPRRSGGLVLPRTIAARRAEWLISFWKRRSVFLKRPIACRRLRAKAIPTRRTGELVAIALRRGIFFRPPALGAVLFLEPIARILVRPAGTPIPSALLAGERRPLGPRRALRLRRIPQLALREPLEHDVRVLPLQLRQRRQQLRLLARAERGRVAVYEDGPVREARRHNLLLQELGVADWGLRPQLADCGFVKRPVKPMLGCDRVRPPKRAPCSTVRNARPKRCTSPARSRDGRRGGSKLPGSVPIVATTAAGAAGRPTQVRVSRPLKSISRRGRSRPIRPTSKRRRSIQTIIVPRSLARLPDGCLPPSIYGLGDGERRFNFSTSVVRFRFSSFAA